MIVFDIETGAAPWEVIERVIKPFEPPEEPSLFDPASVKVGRLTKEKAEAKVEEARKAHQAIAEEYPLIRERAYLDWKKDSIKHAALKPEAGRVLAIGYHAPDTERTIIDGEDGNECQLSVTKAAAISNARA